MSETKQKYTPGPWRWEFNEKSKDINLCGGKTRYDLTVMDFVRYGMGGAQPRFNIDHGNNMQLMHKASEMGAIVKGREHHANWFKNISHPDAQLIASAPCLIEALQDAVVLIRRLKLSMLAHPDCTEGSEFDDYTSSAQEFEDAVQLLIDKSTSL